MKIAGVQLWAARGDIEINIEKHVTYIESAAAKGAEAIFFPELSLSGYEPELAAKLATTGKDNRLVIFQNISDEKNLIIGAGLPVQTDEGVQIGMVIFQPHALRQVYAKQYLHNDEQPYFVAGSGQLYVSKKSERIAPAICYESLLLQHAEQVHRDGATFYLTSVAKSAKGVARAYEHYPYIAVRYGMPVLMINAVGHCDNFMSAGASAAWNAEGKRIAQLSEEEEGMIVMDTHTGKAVSIHF